MSTFSKILEKIFFNRLVDFLSKNNILTQCQHGFRKSRSTETAMFSFLHDVASALDRGENPVGLFLDLSKAFDVINHNILIAKLPSYGIHEQALSWLSSYLKNILQRVENTCSLNDTISRHLSELISITNGVPQGSILGPILFLL